MSTTCFTSQEILDMASTGVTDFFTTMLSQEIEIKSTLVVTPEDAKNTPTPHIDTDDIVVSGCVGFIGDVKGLVYIFLRNDFSVNLTSEFLGLDVEDILAEGNELVNDALGEMSNMIAGAFKNQMSDKGIHCNLTVPNILRGKRIDIETPASESINRYFIVFNTLGQEVILDISMKID